MSFYLAGMGWSALSDRASAARMFPTSALKMWTTSWCVDCVDWLSQTDGAGVAGPSGPATPVVQRPGAGLMPRIAGAMRATYRQLVIMESAAARSWTIQVNAPARMCAVRETES